MDFTEDQLRRYARHIILPEVGGVGQERLLKSKVLAIGAGGLGSPLLLYLAAAGVGVLGVADDDTVDLSNLQRQIAHSTPKIGMYKADSAAETLQAINPDVQVMRHRLRLNADNARDLIREYDIIADGSDNFATRFLVNDACHLEKKTLVSAAILRFDGQLSTYKTHAGGPCYRCIFREPPPPGQTPTCSTAGVLGAIAGTMGALQATEVLKELLQIGESMAGRLLIYDALSTTFRTITVPKDPGCPLCGKAPAITGLDAERYRENVC